MHVYIDFTNNNNNNKKQCSGRGLELELSPTVEAAMVTALHDMRWEYCFDYTGCRGDCAIVLVDCPYPQAFLFVGGRGGGGVGEKCVLASLNLLALKKSLGQWLAIIRLKGHGQFSK